MMKNTFYFNIYIYIPRERVFLKNYAENEAEKLVLDFCLFFKSLI